MRITQPLLFPSKLMLIEARTPRDGVSSQLFDFDYSSVE